MESTEQHIKSPNVWFTADLHFRHKNILRHQSNRMLAMGLADENDIEKHDQYLFDMWCSMVKRGDHVYVLGDFILSNKQDALTLLHRLKQKTGCKIHLIVGNHDKATKGFANMFQSIDLIKVVDFKKSAFPFLDEDFTCVLCHYPLKSWPRKCFGAVNLFGHIHNNAPWVDTETDDLCLNVGVDTPFANYKLVSLEQVYEWYKKKLNGLSPKEYIEKISESNPYLIR